MKKRKKRPDFVPRTRPSSLTNCPSREMRELCFPPFLTVFTRHFTLFPTRQIRGREKKWTGKPGKRAPPAFKKSGEWKKDGGVMDPDPDFISADSRPPIHFRLQRGVYLYSIPHHSLSLFLAPNPLSY